MLAVSCGLPLAAGAAPAGWATLSQQPPETTGTMLLLSDGTVMAEGGGSGAKSKNWYKLTPDSTGGYTNGQWTTLAPMHYSRLYFASEVLQDGRVFVAGAEYGTGTTNAEIYDPIANAWTVVPIPAGIINKTNSVRKDGSNTEGFVDSAGILLSTGSVLVMPDGVNSCGQMAVYNPGNNTWTSNFLIKQFNEDAPCSCASAPACSLRLAARRRDDDAQGPFQFHQRGKRECQPAIFRALPRHDRARIGAAPSHRVVQNAGVRDLVSSEPYLHTGQMNTIEDALNFYLTESAQARAGTIRNAGPRLSGISLDAAAIAPLAAFLRSLDEENYADIPCPCQ
ncbi:MAG TPA: hypothetical protein VGO59_14115 [Verrucomicrobiae bacterium]